jgi:hypothetical protein
VAARCEPSAARMHEYRVLQRGRIACLVPLHAAAAKPYSTRDLPQLAAATHFYLALFFGLQDQADVWCEARPPPSFPPTANQLRQLRVAIIVDPVCRRYGVGCCKRTSSPQLPCL